MRDQRTAQPQGGFAGEAAIRPIGLPERIGLTRVAQRVVVLSAAQMQLGQCNQRFSAQRCSRALTDLARPRTAANALSACRQARPLALRSRRNHVETAWGLRLDRIGVARTRTA